MRASHSLRWAVLPGAVLSASTSGFAATYLTTEQAQAALFPGGKPVPADLQLSPDQCAAVEKASGVRVRSPKLAAWKVENRGWLLIDTVLGKHEYITFAVGIDTRGAVLGVEIMEYKESYGYEVKGRAWRDQFVGKTGRSPLKLDQDIRNISGATLSCRHVTDGVKRLLATYELALRGH